MYRDHSAMRDALPRLRMVAADFSLFHIRGGTYSVPRTTNAAAGVCQRRGLDRHPPPAPNKRRVFVLLASRTDSPMSAIVARAPEQARYQALDPAFIDAVLARNAAQSLLTSTRRWSI